MKRLALVALLLAALAALTGCLSVPTSGPVVDEPANAVRHDDEAVAIVPPGPRAGATPSEVVEGFLDAMQATPVSTTVARQYLSPDLANTWDPARRIITYGGEESVSETDAVDVRLDGANWLDERGNWRGPLSAADSSLRLTLAQVDGEWRITQAPNALVVPQEWFETRFRQISLYFFDGTGRILVPEPVFVPTGSQSATTLVRDLMLGPARIAGGALRTFLPSTATEGLSVPVNQDGEADVEINDAVGSQSPHAVDLMAAQLAWTLRQLPAVRSFRLTLVGPDGPNPNGGQPLSLDAGLQYDPTGYAVNNALYALRGGRAVSWTSGTMSRVAGPWARPHDVTDLSVDLTARYAAAVSDGGRRILEGPLSDGVGRIHQVPLLGSDLLRPAWDYADRLWLLDRTDRGAVVRYVPPPTQRSPAEPVEVRVPGISGRDVRSFLVSRDGTRLVAVVHGPESDSVVVSRLRSDGDGHVVAATRARVISNPDQGANRISMLAWKSPTEVVAVQQLTDTALVRVLSVDGSVFTSATLTVGDRIDMLVGSPVVDDTLYALAGDKLLDLSGRGRNLDLGARVSSIGYVG